MRQGAESGGQRACIGHRADSQKSNTTTLLHRKSLPWLSAFLGKGFHYQTCWRSLGESVEDKKKVKKQFNFGTRHNTLHYLQWLPRNRNVQQCTDLLLSLTYMYAKKPMEHIGEHFARLLRTMRHTRQHFETSREGTIQVVEQQK